MKPKPLALSVNANRGTLSLARPGGIPLIPEFWLEFESADGAAFTTCQGGFKREGKSWVCGLADGEIRLTLGVERVAAPGGLLLSVSLKNCGEETLRLKQVRLLRGRLPAGSPGLGDPGQWKLLKMGYTFGGAHKEDGDGRCSALVDFPGRRDAARSWGVAALRSASGPGGLVLGFATSRRQMAWVDVKREGGEAELSATVETEGGEVLPGKTLELERLYLGWHDDLAAGLSFFGRLHGRLMGAKPRPAPAGWCSWYFYRSGVTEQAVIENAKFARERFRASPLSVIQVDDGWEGAYGDWLEANKRFPHGMEWLAGEIRKLGFVPGIWAAPFAVQPFSKLFREHPDWLVKDPAGNPIPWDVEWAEPKTPWYGLDTSHPDVLAWLKETFGRLRRAGYRYFKLDFLFMGCLRGVRAERVTRVEAFRRGLSAIRSAVGDSFVLACTAPYPPCVGLVDGARTSHDIYPGGSLADSFGEASREAHQRFWANGSLWSADADAVVLRQAEGSDESVAGAVAASVLLSGGTVMSGDALPELPPDRARLMESLLRAKRGSAGVPLDLFERERPRVVAQPAGRRRWRVGVFNFDPFPRSVALDLRKLGLARAEVRFLHGLEAGAPVKARGRVMFPPVPPRGAVVCDVTGK